MPDLANIDVIDTVDVYEVAPLLPVSLANIDLQQLLIVQVIEPPVVPVPQLVLRQESGRQVHGDLRLTLDEWSRADVLFAENDLATDAGLETALLLSLFTDRYDDETEEPTQRRGWWADGLLGDARDRGGSRLWKLDRAKRGPNTPDEIRAYAREATQWLIDDRVTSALEFEVEVTTETWSLTVAVHRPRDIARFRFERAWAEQGRQS